MDISFNTKGTVVILRTTNVFGGNFDLFHIVNVSGVQIPRVHLIYSTPHQPVAGFSVNTDGDVVAFCLLGRQSISVLRLTLGVEIYRIDLRKLAMSALVGMTFVPGGSVLMTAHSGGQAVFWDIKGLVEHRPENILPVPDASSNGESAYISATGNTIALTSTKWNLPLVLRLDRHGDVQTLRITLPFFDRQSDSFPIALADYGSSILVGRYVCFLNDKPGRRKLSVPTKAKIMGSAATYNSKIALALLQSKQWSVRVFDPSPSGDRSCSEWTMPASGVTNVWGMAFDGQDNILSIGVQQGVDCFAVHFLARRLALIGTVGIPAGQVPMKMAFSKTGSLRVLSRSCAEDAQKYSRISINVPTNTKAPPTPTILHIQSYKMIPPAITSEGEVFYLGVEKYDGWIMRVNEEARIKGGNDADDERVAWCPLSWRSIGNLTLLCASKGETATIVCMNKELGTVTIKAI